LEEYAKLSKRVGKKLRCYDAEIRNSLASEASRKRRKIDDKIEELSSSKMSTEAVELLVQFEERKLKQELEFKRESEARAEQREERRLEEQRLRDEEWRKREMEIRERELEQREREMSNRRDHNAVLKQLQELQQQSQTISLLLMKQMGIADPETKTQPESLEY
jgi:hypothetical protein